MLGKRMSAFFWIFVASLGFSLLGLLTNFISLRGVPLCQYMYYRTLIGYCASFIQIKKGNLQIYYKNRKVTKWLYIRALCGTVCTIFWYAGVVLIPLGDAISMILLSPVIVVVLSAVLLGERFTFGKFGGTLVGFFGVVLVAKPETIFQYVDKSLITSYVDPTTKAIGVILCLLSGFFYGLEAIVIRYCGE